MSTVDVTIQQLDHGHDLPLPDHATAGAAGVDLLAAIAEPVTIEPRARHMIATGIAIQLPENFEAQIRPRSGLAAKHGVTVLNSPGTIDCDYRGEIKVILINHGDAPIVIERGMRIAQMVVAPVRTIAWNTVDNLDDSARGARGFGSTGMAGSNTAHK